MSAFTQTKTITKSFVPDHNPLYAVPGSDTTRALTNTAENIVYESTSVKSFNKQTLSFEVFVGDTNFLNKCVVLNVRDIPLIFTRTTVTGGVVKADDYITSFFASYGDLAMRQFGFLNCIESITVGLGSKTLKTIHNVGEMFKLLSTYYDDGILGEYFDCSATDLYQKYSHHGSNQYVKTYSESGSSFGLTTGGVLSSTIFANVGTDSSKNTRTPMLIYNDAPSVAAGKVLKCKTTELNCYIPFSIFSMGIDKSSLVGVQNLQLNINLKAEWWKYLFCGRGIFTTAVEYDNVSGADFTASINTTVYTAPSSESDQIRAGQIDAYNFQQNMCEMVQDPAELSKIAAGATKSGTTSNIILNAVPKTIYIGFCKKMESSSTAMVTTDSYARIEDLRVEICGRNTILATQNPGRLYQLAKVNGLNMSKEQALFLGSFPLKIDVSDNLALSNDLLIGQTGLSNNILRYHYTIRNLDDEDNNYILRTVIVYDGEVMFENNQWTEEVAIAFDKSSGQTITAKQLKANSPMPRSTMLGGAFFKTLANLGKSGIRWLAKNPDKIAKAANFVSGFLGDKQGAGFDNHSPALGGKSNMIAGNPLSEFKTR